MAPLTNVVNEGTAVLLEAGRVADEAVARHLCSYFHIARLSVLNKKYENMIRHTKNSNNKIKKFIHWVETYGVFVSIGIQNGDRIIFTVDFTMYDLINFPGRSVHEPLSALVGGEQVAEEQRYTLQ